MKFDFKKLLINFEMEIKNLISSRNGNIITFKAQDENEENILIFKINVQNLEKNYYEDFSNEIKTMDIGTVILNLDENDDKNENYIEFCKEEDYNIIESSLNSFKHHLVLFKFSKITFKQKNLEIVIKFDNKNIEKCICEFF